MANYDPLHDRLWGCADLAAYLGYTEATVKRLASSDPRKLPPRVGALSMLRWEPGTVRLWAAEQAKYTGKRRLPGPTKAA